MRVRFYPDELKDEAIRLVVKRRLTMREAAMQLGLRSEVVRVWVRRFRCERARSGQADQLRTYVERLVIERDVLARLLKKTS